MSPFDWFVIQKTLTGAATVEVFETEAEARAHYDVASKAENSATYLCDKKEFTINFPFLGKQVTINGNQGMKLQ